MPLTEGRAKNSDLLSIYLDPLILYVYAASAAFFIALYKSFRLLGYIRQNKVFSPASVSTLRSIQYCAVILGILIAVAGIFIKIFHAKDDDPAGFLAICAGSIVITIVIATAAGLFKKILQKGMNIQLENEKAGQQKK